jgi:hypothetical protein
MVWIEEVDWEISSVGFAEAFWLTDEAQCSHINCEDQRIERSPWKLKGDPFHPLSCRDETREIGKSRRTHRVRDPIEISKRQLDTLIAGEKFGQKSTWLQCPSPSMASSCMLSNVSRRRADQTTLHTFVLYRSQAPGGELIPTAELELDPSSMSL